MGIGHKILALGTVLKHMKMTWRVLSKLDEFNELLSKISQEEGQKLIWALKPAMLALIQPKFLEEPCEGVKLPVSLCLSNIMKLTAPIAPYNDDVMRRIMRSVVETFQDLDNSAGSTFGKKLEILGSIATFETYVIMFDLECDDLILQMFQCFFNIRRHHSDTVITHMQSILSSCMRDCEAIFQELQTRVLSIWRREKLVSPVVYELAQGLVEQNIGLFRRKLTREELLQLVDQAAEMS